MAWMLCGCSKSDSKGTKEVPGATAGAWFEDITARSGVKFVHQTAPPERYQVPDQMGAGAALFDFDGDGRLDLFLVQSAGPASFARNALYHQQADGSFQDVSAGSGLDLSGWGTGVAVGDVNNDGRPDVLVCEYGGARLFVNRGGGKFLDVTQASGMDNPRWATSAAFFDYDRDGWLDLVVANYLDYDASVKCQDVRGQPEFCGPHGFPGLVTKLYRNMGKEARFDDVTVSSGLARLPGPALGVFCADFDGDRWPDIFLADDGRPNRLFINQRNGSFKEEAAARGVAYNAMGQTAGNMGVAPGDVDGDGLFDLFVTHLTEEYHALWMQGPRGIFQDRMGSAGLAEQSWRGTGFGAALADFDNDGAVDLAFVNGLVKRSRETPPLAPGVPPFWARYAQQHQLFANDGRGGFRDVSGANPAFCGRASVGRGLACGDLDGDGGIDLIITSTGSPVQIFRNVARKSGHWLLVRAIDPSLGGRDAYGAEIVLHAAGRKWWRIVQPGFSYLCSSDPRAHFGLGSATSFDSIEVTWPDGAQEKFPGGAGDRILTLSKGSGAKP